jgi:hypothetical protein
MPLLPAFVLAVLAFPAAAAAEPIVPPSNSAASQYTEAIPTAGGEQKVGGHKKGKATPTKVLGGRDTHRLESKGKQGREVAKFAAETSPAPVATPEPSGGSTSSSSGSAEPESHAAARKGHGAGKSGDDKGSAHRRAGAPGGSGGGAGPGAEPGGSSGFGEVIGQATGSSSSGQLGLLLPLALIGTIVWSLVFLWRQRRRIA